MKMYKGVTPANAAFLTNVSAGKLVNRHALGWQAGLILVDNLCLDTILTHGSWGRLGRPLDQLLATS